jgi:hypothetical protein
MNLSNFVVPNGDICSLNDNNKFDVRVRHVTKNLWKNYENASDCTLRPLSNLRSLQNSKYSTCNCSNPGQERIIMARILSDIQWSIFPLPFESRAEVLGFLTVKFHLNTYLPASCLQFKCVCTSSACKQKVTVQSESENLTPLNNRLTT